MLITLFLALQATAPDTTTASTRVVDPALAYSGVAGETTILTPRLEGVVTIDGRLDEPQWNRAALLHGFSQYNPVDGQPALDSTRARVWYTDDAIYFGIRAYAAPGEVRGTLADRDRINNDDNVQVILDTFNDNRRAFVFAANPLGVQADGVRSEGGGGGGRGPGGGGPGGGGGGGGGGFSRLNLSAADLSQDMIWESKGQVTEFGYQVEMRIPFGALRFDPTEHTWGINVVRTSQYRAVQDSWAPARRGSSSILTQSGRLTGLSELHRGLVLDVTPFVTSSTNGALDTDTDRYAYQSSQALGGDVRWGITPNLTLNATVRPDFSQVEADAGQIPGDVRFAVSFPELRPFFVEGSENFDAPNRLVYTRRIVQPVGATKLIGKVGANDIALLSAVDGVEFGSGGHNPVYNVLRLRRDVGAQSTLGVIATDREEAGLFNRVAAVDARFVFENVYTTQFQMGGSSSDSGDGSRFGRIWEGSFDRSGRSYGFRNSIKGLSEDFGTQTGFVNRVDNVELNLNQRYTNYGAPGSRLQQVMWSVNGRSLWSYGGFFARDAALESRLSVNLNATFRGGWGLNLSPSVNSDRFVAADYDNRFVVGTAGDTVPFVPGPPVRSGQLQLRASTPQFEKWALSGSVTAGSDADYLEAGRSFRKEADLNVDYRPTAQARVTGSLRYQQFIRDRDRTPILETTIPRVRLEYQVSRAIQVRFVGQYENRSRSALVDPATGRPIVTRIDDGSWFASEASTTKRFRADWLVAFVPTPGRVIYVGYGTTMERDDDALDRDHLRRTSDGLFVKASYQFRIR